MIQVFSHTSFVVHQTNHSKWAITLISPFMHLVVWAKSKPEKVYFFRFSSHSILLFSWPNATISFHRIERKKNHIWWFSFVISHLSSSLCWLFQSLNACFLQQRKTNRGELGKKFLLPLTLHILPINVALFIYVNISHDYKATRHEVKPYRSERESGKNIWHQYANVFHVGKCRERFSFQCRINYRRLVWHISEKKREAAVSIEAEK